MPDLPWSLLSTNRVGTVSFGYSGNENGQLPITGDITSVRFSFAFSDGQVRCFGLLRVMQLLPQAFYGQTYQTKRNGIRDQSYVETKRVVHTHYRNRARYADNRPHITHPFGG